MDNGSIVEFDTPSKLIENKDGYFYHLVMKSGNNEYINIINTMNHQINDNKLL